MAHPFLHGCPFPKVFDFLFFPLWGALGLDLAVKSSLDPRRSGSGLMGWTVHEAMGSIGPWSLEICKATAVKPFWRLLDLRLVHFFEGQACKAVGIDFCHEENEWINEEGSGCWHHLHRFWSWLNSLGILSPNLPKTLQHVTVFQLFLSLQMLKDSTVRFT